ncbi:MAG: zinc metallopeptidase [Lachnospiraceae bacterium]|nr:zinc metallopeptidase [Lachnospiraceae bacterium]
MFYYDSTYILVLIGAALVLIAQGLVKSAFSSYSRVRSTSGMTGAEAAQRTLHDNGIYDVKVQHISGSLTDHFNPATKTVNLSDSVYGASTVAAIAVACHECGHAMQHNEEYFPLKLRSAIVPAANIGSKAGLPILFAGIIFSFHPVVFLGILLFTFGVAFQIVTLPVEFNASARALAYLENSGLVADSELAGSKKVLRAAALTYVASAASAILSLLRLILISRGNGGRRRD